jgi:hypothetical protein
MFELHKSHARFNTFRYSTNLTSHSPHLVDQINRVETERVRLDAVLMQYNQQQVSLLKTCYILGLTYEDIIAIENDMKENNTSEPFGQERWRAFFERGLDGRSSFQQTCGAVGIGCKVEKAIRGALIERGVSKALGELDDVVEKCVPITAASAGPARAMNSQQLTFPIAKEIVDAMTPEGSNIQALAGKFKSCVDIAPSSP